MRLPVAILAGGLATRLRPHTEKVPKSLLEVAGKPFAVHQVELLTRHGFKDIVFCVGHFGEQIEQCLGNGRKWGAEIRYSFDGPQLLGTGGSLRHALNLLGQSFLVVYGDSYLECDYEGVATEFQRKGRLGLMTVFRNEGKWDKSNVAFINGEIRRYDKSHQTSDMKYIDYGLGAFSEKAFDSYDDAQPFDLATVYAHLLAAGQLTGLEVAQRFYEIGSAVGLEETAAYLQSKRG